MSLILFTLLSLIINCLIFYYTITRYNKYVLVSFIELIYLIQALFLFVYLCAGGETVIGATQIYVNIADHPQRIFMALTFVPIISLITMKILGGGIQVIGGSGRLHIRTYEPATLNVLLALSALSPAFYYAASALNDVGGEIPGIGLISHLLVFIHGALFLGPAIVGYYHKTKPAFTYMFLVAFAYSALFALEGGSRTTLFYPILYYVVGFIMALNKRQQRYAILVFLICAPLALFASGLIGIYRPEVKSSGITDPVERAASMISAMKGNTQSITPLESIREGLGRMVVWSSLAVVSLTPEEIEYRGFKNIRTEIQLVNQGSKGKDVQLIHEVFAEERVGFGAALDYGLPAHYGWTVPFPLVAEAWSRGGAVVLAIYAVLWCVVVMVLEVFARRLFGKWPKIIMFIIAIEGAVVLVKGNESGFVYQLRGLALATLFWFTILYLMEISIFPAKLKPKVGIRNILP